MQSEGEKPVKRPMRGQSMGLRKNPSLRQLVKLQAKISCVE